MYIVNGTVQNCTLSSTQLFRNRLDSDVLCGDGKIRLYLAFGIARTISDQYKVAGGCAR